jgi:hypothetical protein
MACVEDKGAAASNAPEAMIVVMSIFMAFAFEVEPGVLWQLRSLGMPGASIFIVGMR